ncbi:gamma-secretase subunit APH-1A [Schistosoma bovis]|uniref:Gamma-secretase subunit APH-1A n=1 Tax=Schistosoma bovis TaxID=6184 RepID=A0A430Q3Q7_SCHBO|nr:gamma-secretase subunit APH-1A [Schistosoma bovis]
MTYLGGVGCTLIGVGPCLVLFLCTVANCPTKVILLTASKAESGLQVIVSSSTTTTTTISRPQLADGINNDNIIDNHSNERGETERNEVSNLTRNRKISSSNIVITNDYDHNILNDNSNSGNINNNNVVKLDHLTIAYASGLGYGLMSCIIQSLRMLIDSYGPGITMYSSWNSKTFFLFSSCQCMCISMLQVFWSLILFSAFVQRAYGQIILVYFMHFGLAGMSLINTFSSPCSEIVCTIYVICLIGMIIFAYYRFRSQLDTNYERNNTVDLIN